MPAQGFVKVKIPDDSLAKNYFKIYDYSESFQLNLNKKNEKLSAFSASQCFF